MSVPARPPSPDAAPRCGSGGSELPDLEAAIREAADRARKGLGADGEADLGVVFVSAAHGGAIRPALDGIADSLGLRAVVAATAEGVLCDAREHESGPVVAVWLARLPGAVVETVALEYAPGADGGGFLGWPGRLEGAWPANAGLVLVADPFSFPVDRFLARMEEANRRKAARLYGVIDGNPRFFRSPVEKESRSVMNVVFRLPSPELEEQFISDAKKRGMVGLKGHRSVGGVRVSTYNAVPYEWVDTLAGFMEEFQRGK